MRQTMESFALRSSVGRASSGMVKVNGMRVPRGLRMAEPELIVCSSAHMMSSRAERFRLLPVTTRWMHIRRSVNPLSGASWMCVSMSPRNVVPVATGRWSNMSREEPYLWRRRSW